MNPIKLVCFDLDKTLINFDGQNSWHALNVALGVTPEEDQKLFEQYYRGEFTYREWQQKLLAIFLKSPKANQRDITEILSKYSFNNGVKEIVAYCKSKGYSIALISGSLDLLVDIVGRDLGIELSEATNKLIFDESGKLKDIVDLGDESIAKLNLLESCCRKLGVTLEECVCIGDGDNDIEMFKKTGRGVTFTGSKIENDAWKVIESLGGLRDLI